MRYGMIFLAAGAAVLLVSELSGLAAMRMLAIALLVGGAVAAGISAGSRPQFAAALKRVAEIFSRTAVCVIAVLLTAPMLAALAATALLAATQLLDSNSAGRTPMLIAGAVVALLLLIAASTALIVGIDAIRGRTPHQTAEKQA